MVSPISGSSESKPVQPVDLQQGQQLTQEQVQDQAEGITIDITTANQKIQQARDEMEAGITSAQQAGNVIAATVTELVTTLSQRQ